MTAELGDPGGPGLQAGTVGTGPRGGGAAQAAASAAGAGHAGPSLLPPGLPRGLAPPRQAPPLHLTSAGDELSPHVTCGLCEKAQGPVGEAPSLHVARSGIHVA